jgi:glycosyltransferase involved in cell wall biosynthesis
MKIFYVSHLFLPRYVGGTEVLTYQVARQMQEWGHDVTMLACENFHSGSVGVRFETEEYKGLKILRFFLDSRYAANPMRAEYFLESVEEVLRGLYARERPDLIHAHHFAYLTTAVATAAFQETIPVVFTATDFWLICPTFQLLRYDYSLCNGPTNLAKCAKCIASRYASAKRYTDLLHSIPEPLLHFALARIAPTMQSFNSHARLAVALTQRAAWNRAIAGRLARLLVPSRFLQQVLTENGIPAERQEFVPFGLDTGWANNLPPRRPPEQLRIGFIGAIAPHKGLHLLVEAFAGVTRGRPASLEIFGDLQTYPDYATQVREQAASLEGVHFRGRFPPAQLGQVFAELDLLVLPSLWYENTPLLLYSAQAAQLPVICSDVGGLAELVQSGKNGWLFRRGDVSDLQVKLQRVLDDPARLAELAAQIPPVKNIEMYAAELLQIYQHVSRQRRNGSTTSNTARTVPSGPQALD